MLPNLTALIPFRNGQATIERLLDSLPPTLPILVVDDGSIKPYTSTRSNVRVMHLQQRGYFSGAVNAGIESCTTDVLVLNQDVWLEGTAWQRLLLQYRSEERLGILGDGVFGHPFLPNGYVQGTFMYMARAALQQVGLLNEKDYPLWGATAEWQVRAARQGWRAKPLAMKDFGMQHARGERTYGSSIDQTLQDEPRKQDWFIHTPPMVSVIITCYNYGRYLSDAVNSLLGGKTFLGEAQPQTLQSFEIIIVDDGSKDDSAAIGAALANADQGIRFLARANGGSAAAANTGIGAALGRYVTVLDADDMMMPTRLEKMVRLAEQNPHAVIYDHVKWIEEAVPHRTRDYLLTTYNFNNLLTKNAMHKGILYERKAWREVGGYPESMREGREDWGFNVALGAKGYCGILLDEPLYYYRRHTANRTLTNTTNEMREYFLEQLQRLFPNLYAGERPMGCCGKGTTVRPNNAARAIRGGVLGGAMMAEDGIGAAGMVKIEYLLPRAGPQIYTGSVTRATYVFGGSRKQGYVDSRDLDALLTLQENHSTVFRLVEEEPAPQAEPSLPPLAEDSLPVPTETPAEGTLAVPQAPAEEPKEVPKEESKKSSKPKTSRKQAKHE